MIILSDRALDGSSPLGMFKISVNTDVFPSEDCTDDEYRKIRNLAKQFNAKKINTPISFHDKNNKRLRCFIISFANANDKKEFIKQIDQNTSC